MPDSVNQLNTYSNKLFFSRLYCQHSPMVHYPCFQIIPIPLVINQSINQSISPTQWNLSSQALFVPEGSSGTEWFEKGDAGEPSLDILTPVQTPGTAVGSGLCASLDMSRQSISSFIYPLPRIHFRSLFFTLITIISKHLLASLFPAPSPNRSHPLTPLYPVPFSADEGCVSDEDGLGLSAWADFQVCY